jgi:hypothetical protein
MLLPTVQSRCPRLRFRPLGPDEVAAALIKAGRSEAEARAIGATADGSVARALEASAGELVDARDVALNVLNHAAVSDDPRRRIETAKELAAQGSSGRSAAADREGLASTLLAMASIVRDVELIASGSSQPPVANGDVRSKLERLTAFQGPRGVSAFAAIDQALNALSANAGVKVVADWVVLQL